MSAPLTHWWRESPFGDFHVFADANGVVRSSSFSGLGAAAADLAPALAGAGWVEGDLPVVAGAVEAWLVGEADAIAAVPVEQPGGPFFQDVWRTLREQPAGEPISYQELAAAAGRPRAMRAVGTACARNSVALFVPCHRVINSGGRLGSYGYGGPGIKAALLAHEAGADAAGVVAARRSATVESQAPARRVAPAAAVRVGAERP